MPEQIKVEKRALELPYLALGKKKNLPVGKRVHVSGVRIKIAQFVFRIEIGQMDHQAGMV